MEGLPLERNDGLRVDDWWLNSVPPVESFYWIQVRVAGAAVGIAPVDSPLSAGEIEHRLHQSRGLTIYGAPISPEQTARRFALTQTP